MINHHTHLARMAHWAILSFVAPAAVVVACAEDPGQDAVVAGAATSTPSDTTAVPSSTVGAAGATTPSESVASTTPAGVASSPESTTGSASSQADTAVDDSSATATDDTSAAPPAPGTGTGGGSGGDDLSTTDDVPDVDVSDDSMDEVPSDDSAPADDSVADDADATVDDTATDDTAQMDDVVDDTATDDSEPPEPMSDCTNGEQDGDESGPDCGGSCPEVCVEYQINQPNEENEDPSGCEPNGNGFMCPRAMVFSPEMEQAARDDWGRLDAPFVYGVVGHDPDPGGVDGASASYSSTCCQCYQLVFKHPTDGNVSVQPPKPMIVQAFNTYAGGPTAFDVYMAVGGHGNFNGCTANGQLYQSYPDTGGDWSGGVRATRYGQCSSDMGFNDSSIASDGCQGFIAGECDQITASEPIQSIARKSCVETNRIETHYHMNWEVMAQRVECPAALTRVTGCQLGSQGLPEADPAIVTQSDAQAAGFRDGYHTTTMEDCCRPTCAWPTNVEGTVDGWSRFYVCDQSGNVD